MKASPAFGRRRLHTNTDCIDCPTPASGPPGLHTTTRELKTCTFQGPALQTPPKFHERTPREREREKKENCGGRREKKARNFGPPTLHPTLSGPHPSGAPLFLGLGLHPSGPPLRGPTLRGPHPLWSQNSTSKNWPKSKLAEVEIGRSRIGRTRKKSWPKSKLAEVDRAQGWGAQNFALFFRFPPPSSLFFSLTGCLLVEFWWFLWRPGGTLKCARLVLSGCRQREDFPSARKLWH